MLKTGKQDYLWTPENYKFPYIFSRVLNKTIDLEKPINLEMLDVVQLFFSLIFEFYFNGIFFNFSTSRM